MNKRQYLCVSSWTHREVLAHNTAGLEPTVCEGDELKLIDTFADRHITREGMVTSMVEVWSCECGTFIPICEGRVLNAYSRGDARPIVRELAEALSADRTAAGRS